EILSELAEHTSGQVAHELLTRGETRTQQSLRRVLLRDHMLPVARIAKLHLGDTPDLHALKMPAQRQSVERLASAANGMASAARKHAEVVVASGLAGDFAEEFVC